MPMLEATASRYKWRQRKHTRGKRARIALTREVTYPRTADNTTARITRAPWNSVEKDIIAVAALLFHSSDYSRRLPFPWGHQDWEGIDKIPNVGHALSIHKFRRVLSVQTLLVPKYILSHWLLSFRLSRFNVIWMKYFKDYLYKIFCLDKNNWRNCTFTYFNRKLIFQNY